MKRAWVPVLLLTGLLIAGCGTSGGTGGATATPTGGGPPEGGWPKLAAGKVTTAMCGLVTDDDYLKFGHVRLSRLEAKQPTGTNAVACSYMGGDGIGLDLQPGVVAAHLKFTLDTKAHIKARGKGAPKPLENVVRGAAESWFDIDPGLDDPTSNGHPYELEFRRGSLLVDLTLSWVKDKDQKPPKTILSALADDVMKRTDAGAHGAGTVPTVRFAVGGHGTAAKIEYTDPNTGDPVDKHHVHLPWHLKVPTAQLGDAAPLLNLTANMPMSPNPPMISCSITRQGRQLAVEPPTSLVVACNANSR